MALIFVTHMCARVRIFDVRHSLLVFRRHVHTACGFTPIQAALFPLLNNYHDVWLAHRPLADTDTDADAEEAVRTTYALHAINHVLKARDVVLKNNSKLNAAKEAAALEPYVMCARVLCMYMFVWLCGCLSVRVQMERANGIFHMRLSCLCVDVSLQVG